LLKSLHPLRGEWHSQTQKTGIGRRRERDKALAANAEAGQSLLYLPPAVAD
jgi:hypothetical protein